MDGEITIRYSSCYQDIIGILINNGYTVIVSMTEEPHEITLRFHKGENRECSIR